MKLVINSFKLWPKHEKLDSFFSLFEDNIQTHKMLCSTHYKLLR
jgi:hypothetical protein